MGGADTGRQYIAAGLVDEISIHLVPVLFGGGTRMFEELDGEHVQLEPVRDDRDRRRHASPLPRDEAARIS